jgi:hypothetical protein
MNTAFIVVLSLVAALSAFRPTSAAAASVQRFRVLSFNVLEGGGPLAAGVGFYERDFGGSRREVVARVMPLPFKQALPPTSSSE